MRCLPPADVDGTPPSHDGPMTTRQSQSGSDHPVRASDAERDDSARRIQVATAQGRLTLQEAEERLDSVFGSRFRHELSTLLVDLPDTEPHGSGAVALDADAPSTLGGSGRPARGPNWRGSRALAIHAVIVVVLSAFLVARWATGAAPPGPAEVASGAPDGASGMAYFWPMFPMFWLFLSLGVHILRRTRRG